MKYDEKKQMKKSLRMALIWKIDLKDNKKPKILQIEQENGGIKIRSGRLEHFLEIEEDWFSSKQP